MIEKRTSRWAVRAEPTNSNMAAVEAVKLDQSGRYVGATEWGASRGVQRWEDADVVVRGDIRLDGYANLLWTNVRPNMVLRTHFCGCDDACELMALLYAAAGEALGADDSFGWPDNESES